MRLLSPILRRVAYPALGAVGYFRYHAAGPASVITYHGVLPRGYLSADPFLDNTVVSVASFRSQLRLLKKHYNVISPDRFRGWLRQTEEMPPRAVLLTCDDGLLNNVTTMLPILREERLQCLFFVTVGSAGGSPEMLWYVELYLMLMQVRGEHQPVHWRGNQIPRIPVGHEKRRASWLGLMKTLSRVDADGRRDFLREAAELWKLDPLWKQRYLEDPVLRQRFQMMGASEVKQLADAGMTIGAHTESHPVLAEQPAELARAEIADCRPILQKYSGQPVWSLAYPFGDPSSVGSREYGLAESAGYECALVNFGGRIPAGCSKFSLPRVHVTAEMSLPVYEANISGLHDRLQVMFGKKMLRRKLEGKNGQ